MRRLEEWMFAPGSARRLAAVRIGLCSLLALRLARPVYVGLSGQPRALFRPVSFMHMFPGLPSRGPLIVLQLLGVMAATLAAAGLRARVTLPVAWTCGLLLNAMLSSLGKILHNDVVLLICLVPLLVAPVADAWSLDAIRKRRTRRGTGEGRDDPVSVAYGWPVRVAMLVVTGAYFFSGLGKVVFSGPSWVLSGNLRWILYTASDRSASPNVVALFVADRAWLAHIVAGATLLLELTFPLVLWRKRLATFYVPATAGLHAGIWLTMNLDYSAWALSAVIVFVDWPWLVEWLRRGRLKGTPRATTTIGEPATLADAAADILYA